MLIDLDLTVLVFLEMLYITSILADDPLNWCRVDEFHSYIKLST